MKPNRCSTLLLLALGVLVAGCSATLPREIPENPTLTAYNLGPSINSSSDDFAPVFMGTTMLFTSNRRLPDGTDQGDDFYVAQRDRNGWAPAENAGPKVNTEEDEGAAFQVSAADPGSIFYVQCETEDGLGDGDIYSGTWDGTGSIQNAKNLGSGVNTRSWDSHPCLFNDILYFSSDRSGGQGGTDIWYCKRLRSGKWGVPTNAGPLINTSGDEKAPYMRDENDTLYLYFSSNGHGGLGGYDIFRIRQSERKSSKKKDSVENIGKAYNSAGDDLFYRVNFMEDTVYVSSNRLGGQGGLDIYAVTMSDPELIRERNKCVVEIIVIDSATNAGLVNVPVTYSISGGAPKTVTTGAQGRCSFKVMPGCQIAASATAPNYRTGTLNFSIPASSKREQILKYIQLSPIPQEAPKDTARTTVIVYFDFDDARLTGDAQGVLDAFLESTLQPMLATDAEPELQLDAHTDDCGTEPYNIALSRRRGAAVSRYLRDHKVPLSSISINAYGETRPAASNASEEGRHLNRRVEVLIVSKR
jgi:outer membrane protein OmpA-like peptidoglycan-associated protein